MKKKLKRKRNRLTKTMMLFFSEHYYYYIYRSTLDRTRGWWGWRCVWVSHYLHTISQFPIPLILSLILHFVAVSLVWVTTLLQRPSTSVLRLSYC